MMSLQRALVRGVSININRCCLQYQQPAPIDVTRARQQHAAYVDALRALNMEVTVLEPHDALPDCCFVEDAAVVTESFTLIGNMGKPERAGETAAVAAHFSRHRKVTRMPPAAKLEGGDVLRIGNNLYVGLSGRTNRAGIDFLRTLSTPHGYAVLEVPVAAALHLKTAVTYAGLGVVVCATAMRPHIQKLLAGFDIVEPPKIEQAAANVLALNGMTLVPAGNPGVSSALAKRGLQVRELDISELQKAEAGLTCLSIPYGTA